MLTQSSPIVQSDFSNYIELPASFAYNSRMAPKVLESQDIDLQQLLGFDFYEQVAQVITASGVVSTPLNGVDIDFTQAAYDDLLLYLKPVIIAFSIARYLEDPQLHITRYGAKQKENPWSKELEEGERGKLSQQWRSKASHYSQNLRQFLDDNSTDYPQYNFSSISSSSSFLSIGISGA